MRRGWGESGWEGEVAPGSKGKEVFGMPFKWGCPKEETRKENERRGTKWEAGGDESQPPGRRGNEVGQCSGGAGAPGGPPLAAAW